VHSSPPTDRPGGADIERGLDIPTAGLVRHSAGMVNLC
jgi:hypothetical protein